MIRPAVPRLLVLVSGDLDMPDRLLEVMGAGPAALLLRAPGLPGGPLFALARDLIARARPHEIPVLVSDRVDVAHAADAAGTHLPARGLTGSAAREILGAAALVGRSCHSAAEVAAARDEGVDYVTLSPLFPTSSHPGREPLGEAAFSAAVDKGSAVLALGGLTPERVGAARAAGAHGVAVLSGVWSAPDPAAEISRYLDALGGPRHG